MLLSTKGSGVSQTRLASPGQLRSQWLGRLQARSRALLLKGSTDERHSLATAVAPRAWSRLAAKSATAAKEVGEAYHQACWAEVERHDVVEHGGVVGR